VTLWPSLHDYGASRAVVMGTWNYTHLEPIPAARFSSQRMTSLLTCPLCGWPKGRLLVLGNKSSRSSLPAQLITAFDNVTGVALFYYVGHGQLDPDEGLCLGLTDSSPEPKLRAATSLTFSDVRRALLGCPAAVKIVILDCCFAGLANQPAGSLAGSTDNVLDTIPRDTGAYTMAATSAYATALYETDPSKARPQTFFTKYLVDLVEAGLPDQSAHLQLEPLFNELKKRLMEDGRPIPRRRNIDAANDFAFAHNIAAASAKQAERPATPDKTPGEVSGRRRGWHLVLIMSGAGLAAAIAVALSLVLSRSPTSSVPVTSSSLPTSQSSTAPHQLLAATAVLTIPDHFDAQSIAFSPDGGTIAVAAATVSTGKGSTFLLGAASHKVIATFTDPGGIEAGSVVFAPSGGTIAVGGGPSADTLLWDIRSHSFTRLTDPASSVIDDAVAYSPDGKTLAVGTYDAGTRLWDVHTRSVSATLRDPNGTDVDTVAFSPDGKTLAITDFNGTAYLWDVAARHLRAIIAVPPSQAAVSSQVGVTAVAFSPDSRTLAVIEDTANGYVVRLWDMTTRTFITTVTYPGTLPVAVAFSPDGKTLAICDNDGSCYLLARTTRSVTATINGLPPLDIGGIAFSRDHIMAIYSSKHIYLYHV
jgi:DNA-binding beta-propeller fold protein YncE